MFNKAPAVTVLTNPKGILHPGTPDRDNPGTVFDDSDRKLSYAVGAVRHLPGVTIHNVTRPASLGELTLVHSRQFIDRFQRECARLPDDAVQPFGKEASIGRHSFDAASTQFAACMDMVDLLKTSNQPVMVLGAPPTHHAVPKSDQLEQFVAQTLNQTVGPIFGGRFGQLAAKILAPALNMIESATRWLGGGPRRIEQPMGFCLLAADAAVIRKMVDDGERVVGIDCDHHFGNAWRDACANLIGSLLVEIGYKAPYDPKTKRYLDYDIDPATGATLPTGSGKEYPYNQFDPSIGAEPFGIRKAGNIIDVLFSYRTPSEKPSPDEIISRFKERTFSRMRKLDPTRIVINLGLDSMANDPLGGLGFQPETYLQLIREIRTEFPNAKLGIILQGGYHWPNYDPCLKAVVYGAQVALSDKRSAAEILEYGVAA